jgi:hypothetical protein
MYEDLLKLFGLSKKDQQQQLATREKSQENRTPSLEALLSEISSLENPEFGREEY